MTHEGVITKTAGPREVLEIDNRPALEVYAQWAGECDLRTAGAGGRREGGGECQGRSVRVCTVELPRLFYKHDLLEVHTHDLSWNCRLKVRLNRLCRY